MTVTSESKLLRRETLALYRSRPLVIELGAFGLTIREKGKRCGYLVDYRSIYELGARKKAEQDRAERVARKKAKKKGVAR